MGLKEIIRTVVVSSAVMLYACGDTIQPGPFHVDAHSDVTSVSYLDTSKKDILETPDLSIGNRRMIPIPIKSYEKYHLDVEVLNNSNSDIAHHLISLSVYGKLYSKCQDEEIIHATIYVGHDVKWGFKNGQPQWYSYRNLELPKFTPSQNGTCKEYMEFTLVLDPDNALSERDESNNVKVITFPVVSKK